MKTDAMTDPEAALRETLSDEVLRKVVEAAEIYWAIEGPVIRDRQAMRDVIISAAAPLLTPRAWQPPVSKFEDPTKDREELIRRLNGWLELGEEMQRIIHFMGNMTKEDLLPDWFEARLCAFVTTETIERKARALPPAPKERQG